MNHLSTTFHRFRAGSILLPVLLFLLLFPMTALADMGPKASLTVSINTDSPDTYTAMIVSQRNDAFGPTMNDFPPFPKEKNTDPDLTESRKILLNKVRETEGWDQYYYYFGDDAAGPSVLDIGYYPPDRFSVVVYFPGTDALIISDYTERNAFDGSYVLNITEEMLGPGLHRAELADDYNYAFLVLSAVFRFLATLAIEIGLAFMFGIREKKQIIFLLILNLVTQGLLNVCLAVWQYSMGAWFIIAYFGIEFFILLVEMIFDCIFLPKLSGIQRVSRGRAAAYAFVANAASFFAGLCVSMINI